MVRRVGVRELRAHLAQHLESATPIAVTRHGRTVGIYVPLPSQPTDSEREAFRQAGEQLQQELERLGLTEDALVDDFRRWRAEQRGS
jgi:antitoxin (DNA-binding transcriptional repressor) of toxin-antitoxin stability system